MPFKILLADDEPFILEMLSYNLREAGYEVIEATDGDEALKSIRENSPDLILLDIMMPKLTGVEVAQMLNEANLKIPYIFLTAKSDEDTEVQCFELGAYDFISKPIKPKVFISRIHAFFKKEFESNGKSEPTELRIADLYANKLTYSVTLPNKSLIKLPKKEFDLLFFLMSQANKVHSRNDLLTAIWGSEIFVVDRTVDVHIRKIREKIGEGYIQTLKGIGYLFDSNSQSL